MSIDLELRHDMELGHHRYVYRLAALSPLAAVCLSTWSFGMISYGRMICHMACLVRQDDVTLSYDMPYGMPRQTR